MDTSIKLCFKKGEGLYVAKNAPSDNVVITPYSTMGVKCNTIKVPEDDLSIRIHSNFGYGKKSYFYAFVTKGGRKLLDFDLKKLEIKDVYVNGFCRGYGIPQFVVTPENWEALFDKIVYAYNNMSDNDNVTHAIHYTEKLNSMFDDEFTIFHTGSKLHSLLSILELDNIKGEDLQNLVLQCCRKFLLKLNCLNEKLDIIDRNQVTRLSSTLFLVHKYLNECGENEEFMRYYLRL